MLVQILHKNRLAILKIITNMSKPVRILSLDGGGVKIACEAIILGRIFKQFPNLFSTIDVFAGTSAGALLALALATKGEAGLAIITPEVITKMFQRSYSFKIWPSEGITAAEYSNRALDAFLLKEFGTTAVCDLTRTIFVPAFKLSGPSAQVGAPPGRWHPEFFTNIGNLNSTERLKDIALRTAAAPTYFPIYQNYCDGAVFANNPAALAVTHVKKSGVNLARIRVLSISGGVQGEAIVEEDGRWGVAQWATPLVDLLAESNVYTANLLCEELLGHRYHRFVMPLEKPVALDATEMLPYLIEAAEKVDLDSVFKWIEEEWIGKP